MRTDETNLVLTVQQPWAAAMFEPNPELRKTIENRTWQTRHDGRIAIHAGKTIDVAGIDMLGPLSREDDRDRGYIIGTVLIAGQHPAGGDACANAGCYGNPFAFWLPRPDPDAIRHQRPDIQHWMLREPRRFAEPIPATGRLRLWDAGPSVTHLIRTATLR
ncbi:MAG: hypothetical protein AB7T06_40130 [Kofleriaceae bacterium]